MTDVKAKSNVSTVRSRPRKNKHSEQQPKVLNLLDLPHEILVLILEAALVKPPDLFHVQKKWPSSQGGLLLPFAKSSKACFAVAVPFLYRHVDVRRYIRQRKHLQPFAEQLFDTNKLSFVRQLALSYRLAPTAIQKLVESCPGLQKLTLGFISGSEFAKTMQILTKKAPKSLSCLCLHLTELPRTAIWNKATDVTLPDSIRDVQVLQRQYFDPYLLLNVLERASQLDSIQFMPAPDHKVVFSLENHPRSKAKTKTVAVPIEILDAIPASFPKITALFLTEVYDTVSPQEFWRTLSYLPFLKNLHLDHPRSSLLANIEQFTGHLTCLFVKLFAVGEADHSLISSAGEALPSRVDLAVIECTALGWSNHDFQPQKALWLKIHELIWVEFDARASLLRWDEDHIWPFLVGPLPEKVIE